MVRRGNTSDGDIITLVSVVFGIVECILLVGAANNIFRALFYLGERSSASSILTPFPPDSRGRVFNSDLLLSFTHLFSVVKCVTYALPTVLLLTQNPDNSTIALNPAAYFTRTMTAAALLSLVVGVIWLIRMLRYTSACVRTGDLTRGLDEMMNESTETTYERKRVIRKIGSALTVFAIGSVFSLDIVFDNFRGISLVPNFLVGIFILISLIALSRYTKTLAAKISAAVYATFSAVSFLFDTRFNIQYDFSDLLVPGEASEAYNTVEMLGIIEIAAFLVMIVLVTISFAKLIRENTGLSPSSERYTRLDGEFHRSLIKKCCVMSGFAALAMLSQFVNIFVSGDVRILETELYDHSPVTLYMPSISWFGLVVTATAIAFIAYAFYFTNLLKEEVRMKYIME